MSGKPPATTLAVLIATAVTVVMALVISWFAWPAKELAPRDLPIVVAGPAPVATAVAEQLRTARSGAFKITTVADAAAADAIIRDRDAYAAFIVGSEGLALHVASAASPTVAAVLTQAAQEIGQQVAAGRPVTVVDVVPLGSDDPRGAGFASGFLPLVLLSMIAGIALAIRVATKTARLVGVSVFAVLAGLVGAATMHWLGLITGDYIAAAGAIALLSLAVSATVTGLAAVLGPPGIGLAVVLVFLFGNPISGVAGAPELLPQPWGEIGQSLPPGAGASLLRSAAFFDGAGAGAPLLTLLAWAAAGLILVSVGRPMRRDVAAAADAAREVSLAT
jgi:hypothetical protein